MERPCYCLYACMSVCTPALSAACGAFVHGMEDEYHEVRTNTVQSLCDLSAECSEFGAVSMSHLVDMLNDEIQSVRLLAISSLQHISEVPTVYLLLLFKT